MTKFSKSIIKYGVGDDIYIEDGYEYILEDYGRIVCTGREYWMTFGRSKFHISKKMKITDVSTSLQVGNYKTSTWLIGRGYNHKLIWESYEYRFKKVAPDVRYSLFKQVTWGHKKYHLFNENKVITYSFNIDTPKASIGSPYIDKPFEGLIEINDVDPVIALAGFVLVERSLNYDGYD